MTILDNSMQLDTCYSIEILKSYKVQTRRFMHTKLDTHLCSGVTEPVTNFKENLSDAADNDDNARRQAMAIAYRPSAK